MDAGSSLWFGCVVQSSGPEVILHEGANVQDNCALSAHARELHIGRDSTIGHNVVMLDCTVGARSLVGMASRLAAGTQVDDDCFVAAGTWTQPGQRLAGGGLWGGRPARRLTDLSDRLRRVILGSAEVYRAYAAEFAARQAQVTRGANPVTDEQPDRPGSRK